MMKHVSMVERSGGNWMAVKEGTYFLPEFVMSGEMLRRIGDVPKPHLAAKQDQAAKLAKWS